VPREVAPGGEARPAYERAFAAQRAVNVGDAQAG